MAELHDCFIVDGSHRDPQLVALIKVIALAVLEVVVSGGEFALVVELHLLVAIHQRRGRAVIRHLVHKVGVGHVLHRRHTVDFSPLRILDDLGEGAAVVLDLDELRTLVPLIDGLDREFKGRAHVGRHLVGLEDILVVVLRKNVGEFGKIRRIPHFQGGQYLVEDQLVACVRGVAHGVTAHSEFCVLRTFRYCGYNGVERLSINCELDHPIRRIHRRVQFVQSGEILPHGVGILVGRRIAQRLGVTVGGARLNLHEGLAVCHVVLAVVLVDNVHDGSRRSVDGDGLRELIQSGGLLLQLQGTGALGGLLHHVGLIQAVVAAGAGGFSVFHHAHQDGILRGVRARPDGAGGGVVEIAVQLHRRVTIGPGIFDTVIDNRPLAGGLVHRRHADIYLGVVFVQDERAAVLLIEGGAARHGRRFGLLHVLRLVADAGSVHFLRGRHRHILQRVIIDAQRVLVEGLFLAPIPAGVVLLLRREGIVAVGAVGCDGLCDVLLLFDNPIVEDRRVHIESDINTGKKLSRLGEAPVIPGIVPAELGDQAGIVRDRSHGGHGVECGKFAAGGNLECVQDRAVREGDGSGGTVHRYGPAFDAQEVLHGVDMIRSLDHRRVGDALVILLTAGHSHCIQTQVYDIFAAGQRN